MKVFEMKTEKRTFEIELRKTNDQSRTVEASISSEYPVERFEGQEILVHAPEAVDLSREPLSLITSHDHRQLNVGLVSNLRISDKKLKGKLTFGRRQEAQEILEDVKSGVLRYLSVGYEILERSQVKNGRYYVTKWRPFEVSIVSVPADPSVGIGRSYQNNNKREKNTMNKDDKMRNTLSEMETLYNKEQRGDQLTTQEQINLNRLSNTWDTEVVAAFPHFKRTRDVGVGGVVADMSSTDIDTTYRTDPTDNGGTRYQVGDNRESHRPFNSMGEQLRAVIAAGSPGGQTDPRLFDVRAASGLNEGTLSEGGFLLQSDFSTSLIKGIFDTGKLPGMCNRFTIGAGKNGINLPAVDETSRASGSRWGGVQLYHTNEADQFTGSKPKYRQIALKLQKLIGLCYLTDELMEDVPAMENYVSQAFEDEFEYMMDDIIINGTGSGQGLGLMNSSALIEVAKESGQSADTIVWENVRAMWARMPAKNRRTAVWLVNQDAEPQLWSMHMSLGTAGIPVYMPAGGASSEPYSTLFGRPVIPMEQCQTVGDKGDIILFDPKSYVIADKGGLKKDISVHVRFLYDEACLRFVYRYDSQPILASAITPANSTITLSPYITLAERAAA